MIAGIVVKAYFIATIAVACYYLAIFVLNMRHAIRCESDYYRLPAPGSAANHGERSRDLELRVVRLGQGSLLLTARRPRPRGN